MAKKSKTQAEKDAIAQLKMAEWNENLNHNRSIKMVPIISQINSKDELKWANSTEEELYEIAKLWSKFTMKTLRGLQTMYDGYATNIAKTFTHDELFSDIKTPQTISYDAIDKMRKTVNYAIDYKNFGE